MWSEPRRAHAAGVITYVLQSFHRSGAGSLLLGTLLPVGVILAFDRIPFAILLLLVVAIVVAVVFFVLATSYLRWLRFSFMIDGETFFVEQGLLFRRTVRLSGQRIQAIDTQANLIFRLLGFVVLNVHTAGKSGAPEVSIPALSIADAEALTQALRALKTALRPDLSRADGEEELDPDARALEPDVEVAPPPAPEPSTVWILSDRNLVILASTSEFISPFLQLTGSLFALLFVAGDFLGVSGAIVEGIFLLAIFPTFFVAWFATAVSAALRYWEFSVARRGEELRVEKGLLHRSTRTVPFGRIQGVRLVESLLGQLIGRFMVSVDSAGVAGSDKGSVEAPSDLGGPTVLHPLLDHQEVRLFFEKMLPGYTMPRIKKLPRRSLLLYLLRGTLLPLVVAMPIAILLPYGWLALAAPIALAAFSALMHHDAGLGTDDSTLVIRRRRIQRTTVLVRRHRIQALSVSQGPLQRVMGVASVRVTIASSSLRSAFRVRDIDQADAWALIEWVRFRSP